MPELSTMETPKTAGFVDRGYNNNKKRAAMEAEEKEIERLEAEARGETVEEESDGEGSEATEVSDASSPKQEEAKEEAEANQLIEDAKITYQKKKQEEVVTIVFSDKNSNVSDSEVNLWFEENDEDSD